MRLVRWMCGPLVWVAFAISAGAQNAPAEPSPITILTNVATDPKLFDFSYGSPQSPVLPLIGVANDQINRVDSFQKFGLSILSGVEGQGVDPAVAIDASPFWLLSSDAISLEDYRKFGSAKRIASRTKTSVAFSEGDESKKRPSTVVFSAATKVLQDDDPLRSNTFERCVKGPNGTDGKLWKLLDQLEKQAVMEALPLPNQAADANTAFQAAMGKLVKTENKKRIEELYKECADKLAADIASRQSLDVGVGLRLNGTAGSLDNLEGSGTVLWGTYISGVLGAKRANGDLELGPFAARGVVSVKYTFEEASFDAATGLKQGDGDAAMVVAGFENFLKPKDEDALRWSLQAGWNKKDAVLPADTDKEYWRYLVNLDKRVWDGVWLSGTLGQVVDGDGVEDDTYVTVGIKFSGPKSSSIANFYKARGY